MTLAGGICISRKMNRRIKNMSVFLPASKLNKPQGGETLLIGSISDEAALHGLLAKIRDLFRVETYYHASMLSTLVDVVGKNASALLARVFLDLRAGNRTKT